MKMVSAGHRKFFLSPQSANPQPNFNVLNPQPQVRNCTFKSLVRTASPQLFMNRVEEFCNQPCPKLICSELISKHMSKVVTCGKYSKRMVDTFYAIKGITHNC